MSFNIALSGINAASTDLSTISNNIANASTTGFKNSRTEFGDFFRKASYELSSTDSGAGVHVQAITQQFSQGSIDNTGNALDLAISGEGFFTLSDNGSRVYTRAGAFGTDHNGYVVNSAGQRLQVYPPIGDGSSFNTGAQVDLRFSSAASPPAATTRVSGPINLPVDAAVPASTSFAPDDPDSYNKSSSATVYDSLGAAHTASMYFAKSATSGEWTLHTTIDGVEIGAGTTLSFDSSGKLVTPADGLVTLGDHTLTNGAAPLAMTLDLSGATQYGSSFSVGSLSQDGYASGELSGLSITEAGVVQARYNNGRLVALGQIVMADFANQQGLQQLGGASWAETFASGQPILGTAGASNFGSIQAGALEASNVDLTEQLVNMMSAQRNYQANSQVISVTDQLLQTIMQIR